MIGGIGCDLCVIARIEKAAARTSFLTRVFTKQEQDYCESRGVQKSASLAARFAAKEAVLKAFGTGLRGGELKEIEIIQDELGKPKVNLLGYFKQLALDKKVVQWHLSLTHEKEYAMAYVVMEVEK